MDLPLFFSAPMFILLVGVLIVVGGIIMLKLHPFLALLLAALVVAWMTPGSAIEQFALAKGATPAVALKLSKQTIGDTHKRLIFPGMAARWTLRYAGRIIFQHSDAPFLEILPRSFESTEWRW